MKSILHLNKFLLLFAVTVLFQYCSPKTSKTFSKTNYEEDLSVHRTEYDKSPLVNEDKKTPVDSHVVEVREVSPTHHIASELDSIKSLIIESNKHIKYVDGYTIQLYSGNDRNKADETKRDAYELIEGVNPRISYEQPNYKVQVGNYYTRLDANAHFNILKKEFVRAVLIPNKIRIDR